MIILYILLNICAALMALNAYRITKTRGDLEKTHVSFDIIDNVRKYARRHGINQKSDVITYSLMPFAGIAAGAVAAVSGQVTSAVVLAFSPLAIVFFLVALKKKKAASVFQKNAYKLYKYILNQSSAGVRPGEAMKKMYEVVSEKKLRQSLMEACAKYSVTMDNDILSDEILKNIDTPEAKSFAMTIRDGLFESHDPDLMERLEQLMFNRYFAYIQRETDNVKTRCLITVVLLCSVIVVMVLIPTFLDVLNALNSIFTQ